MKTSAIYITVRIDIETDDSMSYKEIKELVSELDYDFRLPKNLNEKVVGTEICDINE